MGALLIAALAVDGGYSLQTTALGPETYSNLKAFLGIESLSKSQELNSLGR